MQNTPQLIEPTQHFLPILFNCFFFSFFVFVDVSNFIILSRKSKSGELYWHSIDLILCSLRAILSFINNNNKKKQWSWVRSISVYKSFKRHWHKCKQMISSPNHVLIVNLGKVLKLFKKIINIIFVYYLALL